MAIGNEGEHAEQCVNPDVHPEPFKMELDIQQSAAGYYLGTWCDFCGPYGRESGYFATHEEAEKALAEWKEGNRVNDRPKGFHPAPMTVIAQEIGESTESFLKRAGLA